MRQVLRHSRPREAEGPDSMRLFPIVAFVVALANAALAAPLPGPGISPEDVGAVPRGKGHTTETTKDRDGDPLIKVAKGPTRYPVYSFDRNRQSRFDAIQFANSCAQTTPERLAAWNKTKRFGRAYRAQDGKSWIEMDVETTRGFSTEALEENLDRGLAVMDEFIKYVAAP